MKYLTFSEANRINASLELMDEATYYANQVREAYEFEFSKETGTVQVYEAPETPRHGKIIGILDENWVLRLWISGPKPRQATFNADVKGIYEALAEYSRYQLPAERKEELRHFKTWLERLEEYDWE